MKLWHDDIRPAPKGWVWARTNEQAKSLIEGAVLRGDFEEASLDHDLGLHDIDPETTPDAIFLKGQDAETGLDLVKWMCNLSYLPPKVRIHSWNPDGAMSMALCLNAHAMEHDMDVLIDIHPFSPEFYELYSC